MEKARQLAVVRGARLLAVFATLSVLGTPATAADDLIWSLIETETVPELELAAGPPESEWTLDLRCIGDMIAVSQATTLDLPAISSGERTASVIEAYGETAANVALDDPIWNEFLSGKPLMVDGMTFAASREEDRAVARRFFQLCRDGH